VGMDGEGNRQDRGNASSVYLRGLGSYCISALSLQVMLAAANKE